MDKCGKLRRHDVQPGARAEGRAGSFLKGGEANSPGIVRTCSACAGDYEDPDRTAGTPDVSDEHEAEDARDEGAEEFPAKK